MILIIDQPNTRIRIENQSIRLDHDSKPFRRVPLTQLEQVVIYGNPLAESTVWRKLATAQIPTLFINARGKPETALLSGTLASQLPFRLMQHQCFQNPPCQLAQACYFVDKKLLSYALPLQILNECYAPDLDDLQAFETQLQQTRGKLPQAESIPELMGQEGQIAHAWFALLAHTLPYQWKFAGRNRRPPRDPVNALLSLGYTLLGSEIQTLITTSGLDPSLGFLHQDYPGREALVLDFQELFRAAIDSFVLQWLSEAKPDESAFYYRTQSGCRLSKKIRPAFFYAWARQRENWPRPFNPEQQQPWPVGDIAQIINGQINDWREHLKQTQSIKRESPEAPEPGK